MGIKTTTFFFHLIDICPLFAALLYDPCLLASEAFSLKVSSEAVSHFLQDAGI